MNREHPGVPDATPGGPLRTRDFLLRAFDDDDASDFVVAARESAGSVGRWMPWCHGGYSDDEARAWFAIAQAGRDAGTSFEYGIFDARTSAFVGGAGLNFINRTHGFCNLGYWVRQSAQRRGAAVQCAAALARHAFHAIGLRRVEIVVAVGNEPSEGVARKVGALFECVARNRLLIGERSSDASVFSLVKADADVAASGA